MDESTDITVLAVNDNPDHLYLLRAMLKPVGYSVLTAEDGRAAFDLLLRERVDILVSDVMMPGLDGIELCGMVRAHPELRSTPILLVSALRKDTASVVEGLRAGADDYLEHPFEPAALVARVARLVARKRSADQLQRLNEELEVRVRMRTRQLERANAELGREIEERRSVEAALEKARDAALEAARLKSEFLANVSHELRTPMHAITGMAELLSKTPLNPKQRELVASLMDGGRSLMEIIDDVLDLSKIEAGKLRIERTDFELAEEVSACVQISAQRAWAKGLELTSSIEAGVPTRLLGDPGRLRQVFNNLLGNAVKFTEAGRVHLGVSIKEETDSYVTLRFEVSDTGIGIGPEATRLIFLPFAQADGSHARAYGGTGLGLAISRQLVELMGGEIGVESEVGRGSVFWFTVTLGKPAGAAAPAPPPGLDGLGILIVAHDPASRDALLKQARGWNMRAEACAAEDALPALREAAQSGRPYAFALLELRGAEEGACELARRMRGDALLPPSTRLILITTRALGNEEEADYDGVFDACLVPPMRRQQLYDCLLALLVAGDGPQAGGGQTRPSAVSTEAGRGAKVLVAEDNVVNQRVVGYMLEELGCEAVVVGDGHQAVAEFSGGRYGLVLMDCQMPVMDGYAAAAAIRRMDGDGRHTPVVALTADAMKGTRERCLAAGMDDYLSKPFTTEQLRAVVDRWLGSSRTANSAGGGAQPAQGEEVGDDGETLDLRLLNRLGGQPGSRGARTVGLVETFISDAGARRRSLGEACDLGDLSRVRREAHALKGGASLFGALRLANICGKVMGCAERADHPALRLALREMDSELARVMVKLQQWKATA